MNYWLKKLILPGIVFILLDVVFILSQQKNFTNQILRVKNSTPQLRIWPAIFCYIFLIYSLYHFIIEPNRPVMDAFILGVAIYGVYETTNYSTLKNWDLQTVLVDITWGGVLMSLTTFIAYNYIK